jgi:hypothetical protein
MTGLICISAQPPASSLGLKGGVDEVGQLLAGIGKFSIVGEWLKPG